MTRPMLDFLIRLHKNGENPQDMVICLCFYVIYVYYIHILIIHWVIHQNIEFILYIYTE